MGCTGYPEDPGRSRQVQGCPGGKGTEGHLPGAGAAHLEGAGPVQGLHTPSALL